MEHVACAGDPEQSYALHLPPGPAPGPPRPLLIAMDPRGRAMIPIGLFKEAAERHGWILVSSWNTLSDGPREANERAMNAILPDVQIRVAVDSRRVYLAGFSGTARAAWNFAERLQPHVAGIVGVGAGLPPGEEPARDQPFDFFGGAGEIDFNYEEVRALDVLLDRMELPHRVVFWPGEHGWPPAKVAGLAVDWLELRAMKRGLRPVDVEVVSALYEGESRRALELEQAGESYGAFRAWRSLARDFEGLRDVTAAAEKAAALEESRAVRSARREADRTAERQRRYEVRFQAYLEDFAKWSIPPLERSLSRLEIPRLSTRASSTGDSRDALAAKRLLEIVFVHCSFYEPQKYLAGGDPARALALSLIAAEIKPDHPRIRLGLARAYARLGRKEEAIRSLERLIEAIEVKRTFLASDADLVPLHDDPAFAAVLARAAD